MSEHPTYRQTLDPNRRVTRVTDDTPLDEAFPIPRYGRTEVDNAVDAARYQFIKAQYARMNADGHYFYSTLFGKRSQTIDEAIDKEMEKQCPTKP